MYNLVTIFLNKARNGRDFMCKLSIIVPIYNVEKYLERCLNSILTQTFKDFELILVDDGSPDNCGKICDYYLHLDSRIKVIHKKNGGLSSARNAGLEIAKGEYIGFVDSDDWIDETMYDTLYNIAKENYADIVQCKFRKIYENIHENGVKSNKITIVNKFEALNDLIKYGEMHVQSVVTWNKIYRRTLFNDIRFPNGKTHEDEFTTYKLFYKSNKIVLTDNELYYYRQVPNSIMNTKFNKKRLDYLDALEEMLNFFKENDNKELYNLVIIRYIDTYRTYYFKCKNLLDGNKDILRIIKNNYNRTFREYIFNFKISLKDKITNLIFFINPQLYKFIQISMKKIIYK